MQEDERERSIRKSDLEIDERERNIRKSDLEIMILEQTLKDRRNNMQNDFLNGVEAPGNAGLHQLFGELLTTLKNLTEKVDKINWERGMM